LQSILDASLEKFVNNGQLERVHQKYSGGEKQKIGFARLFLKNPKICILDEAISGIDVSTASSIINKFIERFKESTKIIIAHRSDHYGKINKTYHIRNGSVYPE
jgi:ABC-type bacteriocin/lantibiotic exporter with double-glycine peptidase domain